MELEELEDDLFLLLELELDLLFLSLELFLLLFKTLSVDLFLDPDILLSLDLLWPDLDLFLCLDLDLDFLCWPDLDLDRFLALYPDLPRDRDLFLSPDLDLDLLLSLDLDLCLDLDVFLCPDLDLASSLDLCLDMFHLVSLDPDLSFAVCFLSPESELSLDTFLTFLSGDFVLLEFLGDSDLLSFLSVDLDLRDVLLFLSATVFLSLVLDIDLSFFLLCELDPPPDTFFTFPSGECAILELVGETDLLTFLSLDPDLCDFLLSPSVTVFLSLDLLFFPSSESELPPDTFLTFLSVEFALLALFGDSVFLMFLSRDLDLRDVLLWLSLDPDLDLLFFLSSELDLPPDNFLTFLSGEGVLLEFFGDTDLSSFLSLDLDLRDFLLSPSATLFLSLDSDSELSLFLSCELDLPLDTDTCLTFLSVELDPFSFGDRDLLPFLSLESDRFDFFLS